jgi:hypothetical protein
MDLLVWEVRLLREDVGGVWTEHAEFAIWAQGEVTDEPGIGRKEIGSEANYWACQRGRLSERDAAS